MKHFRSYLVSASIFAFGLFAEILGPTSTYGRSLYRRLYFVYKRCVEDRISVLLVKQPGIVGEGNILDIGANVGFTAIVLAKYLRPGYLVYAFEPERFNFQLLCETVAAHRVADRVIALRLAIGAVPGSAKLVINRAHPGDHHLLMPGTAETRPTEEVELESIDHLIALAKVSTPIALIKIDVQGMEGEVCRGLKQTIEQHPDIKIIVEIGRRELARAGTLPIEVFDFLGMMGLIAFQIGNSGELSPLNRDQLVASAAESDSEYLDVLFCQPHVASKLRLH